MTLKDYRVCQTLIVLNIYAITSSYPIKTKRLCELTAEQQPRQDLTSKGHRMTLKGDRI